MKPIIYLWPAASPHDDAEDETNCIAVEWQGEDVIHVHIGKPKNLPPGNDQSCRIVHIPDDSSEHECRQQLSEMKAPLPRVVLFIGKESRKCICGFVVDSLGEIHDADVNRLPNEDELYSRSQGLLEGQILADKRVVIIGLGSFGSLIAVELAKAGIGGYSLFDFDRIEPSNIARHACGLQDLGRLKTNSVKDLILQKNPFARVATHDVNINECLPDLKNEVAKSDLVISVTDENRSRLNINQVALSTGTPAIFGRAITRAAGGDVFRFRPNEGPCLNCVFGAGLLSASDEISTFRQADHIAPAYVDRESLGSVVQVGLSSDIVPITNMMVKLALLEISRGLPSGLDSLTEDLTADFYIWANRRDESYAEWPPMEYQADRISILRWYGAQVDRDENCVVCGKLPEV